MGGSESSETAFAFGAEYVPAIIEYHQWWRLISACFVHFGWDHISMNMISLYFVGSVAEPYLGRIRYILLYMISGITGNLLTLIIEMQTGDYSLSAGASGAICGLLSVFIILAIDPRTRRQYPIYRVIIGILLVLSPGLTDHSISMTAHLGGFAGGLVISFIYYFCARNKIRR